MKKFKLLLLFAVGIINSGCSRVIIEPYDEKTYTDGIRFYRPQSYVLVSKNEDKSQVNGGNKISIIYLPNMSEEYVVRAWVMFGSVSMKPTLNDGWNLTALDSSADPKIPEMITALVGAAKLGLGPTAMALIEKDLTNAEPGLYRLSLGSKADPRVYLVGPVEVVTKRPPPVAKDNTE